MVHCDYTTHCVKHRKQSWSLISDGLTFASDLRTLRASLFCCRHEVSANYFAYQNNWIYVDGD